MLYVVKSLIQKKITKHTKILNFLHLLQTSTCFGYMTIMTDICQRFNFFACINVNQLVNGVHQITFILDVYMKHVGYVYNKEAKFSTGV